MKWATQSGLGLDRPPCFWLIRKFVDPKAEFFLFPKDHVLEEARKIGAKVFHVPGGDYGYDDEDASMIKIMKAYGLVGKDPALDLFAKIFNDAAFITRKPVTHPQAHGIVAINRGLRVSTPDDWEREKVTERIYEALYQWCRLQVEAPAPAAAR
jgi:hypothetical protein